MNVSFNGGHRFCGGFSVSCHGSGPNWFFIHLMNASGDPSLGPLLVFLVLGWPFQVQSSLSGAISRALAYGVANQLPFN